MNMNMSMNINNMNRPSVGGLLPITNPPAPRNEYSFPPIKTNEMILCLSELGIQATEDIIIAPEKSKDAYRNILENLAEICTAISKEEMNQPAFSGLSALNYPDLHDESIPQLNAFRVILKMMDICGIRDFTIKVCILKCNWYVFI